MARANNQSTTTNNGKYDVDKTEISKISKKIKEYEKKYMQNWSFSCIYIIIMGVANVLIAGWITFGFDDLISEKGPSAISIILALFTALFAFIHPWKTYISAKSTYKALAKIKSQYEDGRDSFEKITNKNDAKSKLRSLIEIAEEVYAKNLLAEDEKGFDAALAKINALNNPKSN